VGTSSPIIASPMVRNIALLCIQITSSVHYIISVFLF
jgi:hypothetical protein